MRLPVDADEWWVFDAAMDREQYVRQTLNAYRATPTACGQVRPADHDLQDGVRSGYDIEQLAAIRECCEVPLVASGGAGKMQDFEEVLKEAAVSAALAASVFHLGLISIPELKQYLHAAGVEVRL